MLSVRESDATQLLSAMATVARISESEGRTTTITATEFASAAQPLVLPTQVIAMNTPAAPAAPKADRGVLAAGLMASVFPSESVLSGSGVRMSVFSAETPRVKVVPAFLEHDLDGVILPR
jgi:hypothetical protein